MLAEKSENPAHIFSLRRRDTDYTVIAERLRSVDLARREYSVIYGGEVRNFLRHENGGGWVEEGTYVRPQVHVTPDAVVLRNSVIHQDVIIIHGGTSGNVMGYAAYY